MPHAIRVAIDVSVLSFGLRTGSAVYAYRLVEALSSMPDVDLRILYYGRPGVGVGLAESLQRPNARLSCAYQRWREFPSLFARLPYPKPLRRELGTADVFHVGEFVHSEPPAGQPSVATVHDVTTVLFPEWHFWGNRLLHRRRLAWIRGHAARVIVDAEATRADTAAVLDLPACRLDVVPLARGTGGPAAASDADVRARLRLGDAPYVLCVGTLEPRKNLVRLVEAFRRLPADLGPVTLVLAGPWGWRTRSLLAALRKPADPGRPVVVTGALEENAVGALYGGATVFAYPSLYEGFGLPVLEAMAAGVPVLTSAGGACAEVAGDAALLVNPASVDAIAAGLELLLRSEDERRRLAGLGVRVERRYTWARTAAATAAVYRAALADAS